MLLVEGHAEYGLTGFPILKTTTHMEVLNFIVLMIIFWGDRLFHMYNIKGQVVKQSGYRPLVNYA